MTTATTRPQKDSSPAEAAVEETPRRSARDRIFDAARELFYRQGIRAVGVESIAQEAGATKMSLYRAFESKDELVAECLKQSEREAWLWWEATTAPHADDPRAALLAIFDSLALKAKTCEKRGCAIGNAAVELTDDAHPARAVVVAYNREKRGCAIGNAAVELTDDAHPARAVVLAYNREKRRRLRALCKALGAHDHEMLADGLQLLMDGAYLSRLSLGAAGPNASLRRAAEALIDSQT